MKNLARGLGIRVVPSRSDLRIAALQREIAALRERHEAAARACRTLTYWLVGACILLAGVAYGAMTGKWGVL